MVPIALALALFLPGNKVMPLADLTFIVFFSMWAAALNKGDVLRALITTTIFTIIAIYAGSYSAPVMNELAQASGLLGADSAGAQVTHLANGYDLHSQAARLLGRLIGGG